MKRLETLKSFENFKISKQAANKITGARTKSFEERHLMCAKVIDNNDGSDRKIKHSQRFAEKC